MYGNERVSESGHNGFDAFERERRFQILRHNYYQRQGRGIQSLFEGIMAAYRNPAAHANLQYEKREAMEQIMLASQLMYVLDKPQL